MCSSRRPSRVARQSRAWWRRRPSGGWFNPHSLRVRVLTVFVGLFALMFVLVGTITAWTLQSFQIHQLDDRLTAADRRFGRPPPDWPGPGTTSQNQARTESGPNVGSDPGGDLADLFRSVQGVDTVGATIAHGQVIVAGIQGDPEVRPLPESLYQRLLDLPADRRPRTMDLGALGTYRLVANQVSPDRIRVTGLPMKDVQQAQYRLILIETTTGLAGLVLSTLAGAGVIRVALRPLTKVTRTARRVSQLPLHEGEVQLLTRVPDRDTNPRSEAGQVGAAINRMLDHVESALAQRQASETRLRQFVADASHELRTPLAAIRGYAELTHRHRVGTPDEVTEAIARVEAAAGRMTTLVEDLLLLARLDARRPLAMAPVDLSAVVVEALSDAHAAGPKHRWLLDLPDEPVSTTGDQVRLHQALANLLANARTHTPPGTTVTVALTPVGDRIGLRVSDDGPGISPALMPRLFERFARGDSSRSRATGSTGLGLAIVAAVVSAHEGTVEASSVPGETTFTIWLPAAGGPQPTHSQDQHEGQGSGAALPA